MQMQVAADRKKRAAVLMAEGEKTSQILKSEAVKQESVNKGNFFFPTKSMCR
jgi:regulator of protease activity HflC (stomatin/prohibitin superfamily)